MTADRSVARDAEPAGLIAAIAARPGWLTVVGLPGVGKSYLVASVTGRDEHTLWVSAERSTSEADLAERIAAACSVAPCDFSRALGRVVERGARTLVLDGADAIPTSIAARVMAASKERGLTLLATARRPIGLGGEVLHPLLPLDRASGSRLFWRIAGESETTLMGMPAGAVEEIVARTDGLPAHLVLLANRLRTYGWDFVRERFLEASGPRSESIPARTEEAFGVSVALLGPSERRVLGAFSVIADDVGLEAVERILGPLWDDSGGASRFPSTSWRRAVGSAREAWSSACRASRV